MVDHSGPRAEVTRRGSIKRGSITWDEEGDLEAKKLKASMEAMGMLKKKQKEFTWDAVSTVKSDEPEPEAGRMTKDQALKTLGLASTTGGKMKKPRPVADYSEDEITLAFQKESKSLSKKIYRVVVSFKISFSSKHPRGNSRSCRSVMKPTRSWSK